MKLRDNIFEFCKSDPDLITIIVPFYNEEDCIVEFCERLLKVLTNLKKDFEIICIDDGSEDNSLSLLQEMHKKDDRIKIVQLAGNYGQTAAISAGIDMAGGDVIIPMDGDLQHLPEEIPAFLKKIEEGYDIVSGWRKKRVDNFFSRRLPSFIANRIMKYLSGVDIHDFGTTFKAYRSDVIKNIRLYGQFHRFIPVLASELKVKITEIPITNIERPRGKSKYGIKRTFTVLFDLIRLKFLTHYLSHPLQIFGSMGFFLFLFGLVVFTFLVYMKYVHHLGLMVYRPPLFITSIFIMLSGIQIFTFGLLAEMLTRIYHDNPARKIYRIRKTVGFDKQQ